MQTVGTRARAILVGLVIAGGLLAASLGTATAARAAAPDTIEYGDRNWSVVCLQQALNYYAWLSGGKTVPAGNVDGIFGQKTLSGVRSVQAFRGRRITGVVDTTTGDDIARGMYYWQGNNQNVKDWLNYCQHTIPRRANYPAV